MEPWYFLIVLLAGFIGGRASARGIQLPDEQDIEGWLQRQKTASLAKNPSNKVRLVKNSRHAFFFYRQLTYLWALLIFSTF